MVDLTGLPAVALTRAGGSFAWRRGIEVTDYKDEVPEVLSVGDLRSRTLGSADES